MDSTLTGRTPLGLLLALGLLAPALSGCGGGGGSAPSGGTTPDHSTPTSATVSGLLESSGGMPLSGYTVVYDPSGAAIKAATGADGRYSLVIPASDITGQDTLSLYDGLGALAEAVAVTPQIGQTVSLNPVLPTAAPPGVPPL